MAGACWHCGSTAHDTAGHPGRYRGGAVDGPYEQFIESQRRGEQMQADRQTGCTCCDETTRRCPVPGHPEDAPDTRPRYQLSSDGDAHWYVIPTAKMGRWAAWLGTQEAEDGGTPPEWAIPVSGSPSRVTFPEFQIR